MKILYLLVALCLPAGAAIVASASVQTGPADPEFQCTSSWIGPPVECASVEGDLIAHASAAAGGSFGRVSSRAAASTSPGFIARANSTAIFEQMFVATGGTGSGTLIGRYMFELLSAANNLGTASSSATVIQGNGTVHRFSDLGSGVVEEDDVQSDFTFGVPFDVSLSVLTSASTPDIFISAASGNASLKLLGFTDTQGNVIQVVAAPEPGLFPILTLLAGPVIYFIRRRSRSGILA